MVDEEAGLRGRLGGGRFRPMRIEGSGAKGLPAIPLVRIGLHPPPPDGLISKTTRGPNDENSIIMTEVDSETEMRVPFIFKVSAHTLSSLSGISSAQELL